MALTCMSEQLTTGSASKSCWSSIGLFSSQQTTYCVSLSWWMYTLHFCSWMLWKAKWEHHRDRTGANANLLMCPDFMVFVALLQVAHVKDPALYPPWNFNHRIAAWPRAQTSSGIWYYFIATPKIIEVFTMVFTVYAFYEAWRGFRRKNQCVLWTSWRGWGRLLVSSIKAILIRTNNCPYSAHSYPHTRILPRLKCIWHIDGFIIFIGISR